MPLSPSIYLLRAIISTLSTTIQSQPCSPYWHHDHYASVSSCLTILLLTSDPDLPIPHPNDPHNAANTAAPTASPTNAAAGRAVDPGTPPVENEVRVASALLFPVATLAVLPLVRLGSEASLEELCSLPVLDRLSVDGLVCGNRTEEGKVRMNWVLVGGKIDSVVVVVVRVEQAAVF